MDAVKALVHPADEGHFDELQGKSSGSTEELASPWHTFFDQLGHMGLADLDRRTQTLARQVRDNGITYNVYASQGGPQRPWALDGRCLWPTTTDS